MSAIRPYREDDLDALYDICLKTGDSGHDASHLHVDPKLVGHIYAAPYGLFEPQLALIAEDEAGVGGYVLGALETPAFEAKLEREWWPTLRPLYALPDRSRARQWNLDEQRAWLIHHPFRAPTALTRPYPSHLHIDLLPRMQGRGLGKAMMSAWMDLARAAGSRGFHFGVSPLNHRALGFYGALGFKQVTDPALRGVWFGRSLLPQGG